MITSIDQLDLSKQYSYADYLKWRIDERLELIKGYIMKMSAPSTQHQTIARELVKQLNSYLDEQPCQWYFAPFDVRLTRFDKKKDKEVTTVV